VLAAPGQPAGAAHPIDTAACARRSAVIGTTPMRQNSVLGKNATAPCSNALPTMPSIRRTQAVTVRP
jgi:hypothetical protein